MNAFVHQLKTSWLEKAIPVTRMTPADLNDLYQRFWHARKLREERLIQNPDIVRLSYRLKYSPCLREKADPLDVLELAGSAYDALLGDRQVVSAAYASQFARSGRDARKPDALNVRILLCVERNPDISEGELLAKLQEENGLGLIEDISDGEISYHGAKKGSAKRGPLKTVSLRGLKDRLSRIKKKFRSRR